MKNDKFITFSSVDSDTQSRLIICSMFSTWVGRTTFSCFCSCCLTCNICHRDCTRNWSKKLAGIGFAAVGRFGFARLGAFGFVAAPVAVTDGAAAGQSGRHLAVADRAQPAGPGADMGEAGGQGEQAWPSTEGWTAGTRNCRLCLLLLL